MADRRPGNVGTCAYRGSVDIELILDAVGTQVPGLRELARRFLEADAAHLGVPLDLASVIAGRAEGAPESPRHSGGRRARQAPGSSAGGRPGRAPQADGVGGADGVNMVRPPMTRSTARNEVGVLVNADHHLVEHRPLQRCDRRRPEHQRTRV